MSARLFMPEFEKLARAGCAVQLFGARDVAKPRLREFNCWMQTLDQMPMALGQLWFARFAHH